MDAFLASLWWRVYKTRVAEGRYSIISIDATADDANLGYLPPVGEWRRTAFLRYLQQHTKEHGGLVPASAARLQRAIQRAYRAA